MQVLIHGPQASAISCEEGGAGRFMCSTNGPISMPSPPSFTTTLGQRASSAMSAFQAANTASVLPAYGPMPSGPPQWFRIMVVPGTALASAVTSFTCGWYCQAS